MVVVNWTPDMLSRFIKAIEAAEAAKVMSFEFEGNEFVIYYARHLAEYLGHTFGAQNHQTH